LIIRVSLFENSPSQGDQIGRIFAHLGGCFLLLGYLKKIKKLSLIFGKFFFLGKRYELSWTKYGLGYVLGEFFTSSSGSPWLGAEKNLSKNLSVDRQRSHAKEPTGLKRDSA
jgi:hypothetical protein